MSERERKRRYSLGVLLTGTLEKKQRKLSQVLGSSWVSRFYVLTKKAIHYYNQNSNSSLFGQEKGNYALSDLSDVKAVPWDKRCFQFTLKSSNKTRILRAEDEDACTAWRTAIEEAILDLNKPNPDEDKHADAGSRKGLYLSGDYRNKQKYWPKILSISAGIIAGNLPDPPPIIKEHIAWAESVNLGTGPFHKRESKAIITLKHGRQVVLHRPQFERALLADYEDVFEVADPQNANEDAKWMLRLRLQSMIKPRPALSVQTFVLPLLLIIVTSIFLLDTWAFGGRWIVWFFAVLMGSSILYNSFCRETRVWYLTPLAWERKALIHQPRHGSSSLFAKITPHFQYLEFQDELVIPTDSFLQVCEQIVVLLDHFGIAFKPLQLSLQDNIQRISKQYRIKPNSLDEMIRADIDNKIQNKETSVFQSTLWIKRTLAFIAEFLRLLVDGEQGKKTEHAFAQAFKEVLEPHQAIGMKAVYQIAMFTNAVQPREKFFESVAKHVPETEREAVATREIREFLSAAAPLLRSMEEAFEAMPLSTLPD